MEVASDRKRSSEDTSPRTSPRKKRATEEMESPPPHDVSLPKGTKEKDLLPRRYEVFASDYEWVQHVRGSSSDWRPMTHLQGGRSSAPAAFNFERRRLKWSLLR